MSSASFTRPLHSRAIFSNHELGQFRQLVCVHCRIWCNQPTLVGMKFWAYMGSGRGGQQLNFFVLLFVASPASILRVYFLSPRVRVAAPTAVSHMVFPFARVHIVAVLMGIIYVAFTQDG